MIAAGSKVKIHYTLKVNDEIIDSSAGREPLEYQHGQGMLVPGVEAGLEGTKPGDKKKLLIPAKDGYGEADPQMVITAPKEAFAQMPDLKVGATVRASGPEGEFRAIVVEIAEAVVKLDLNHPLAGKTLDFEIEVVAVEPPPSRIIRP
ncbi:MAG: peptidylprolyl isomerase [Elusimicrobia bacterium]|nr:peptidylprolyl isomerase [Elusimicrobiota bacterium]